MNCVCFPRKDQAADHLENADLEYYDYDAMTEKENKTQQEDNREKPDKDDPNEDGDGDRSYEDDVDFDDYNEQDGDQSDEECGDKRHSRLSNASRVSDVGKRSTSPLTDDGRKEDRTSRCGSQEYVSGKETEGKEQDENDDED